MESKELLKEFSNFEKTFRNKEAEVSKLEAIKLNLGVDISNLTNEKVKLTNDVDNLKVAIKIAVEKSTEKERVRLKEIEDDLNSNSKTVQEEKGNIIKEKEKYELLSKQADRVLTSNEQTSKRLDSEFIEVEGAKLKLTKIVKLIKDILE